MITAGLVFFSVLALVLFGGDVLRGFSLALFIGVIVGTYSTIAIASPIMVWWQQRLEPAKRATATRSSSNVAITGNASATTASAKSGKPKAAARSSQRPARS